MTEKDIRIQEVAGIVRPSPFRFIGAAFWFTLFSQVSYAATPKPLLGDWQGVFQCGDSEFNFTLSLHEHQRGLAGEVYYKALHGQRLGLEARSPLVGSAEEFGKSLSVETSTNDLSKHVWVKMVYDQQTDRLFGKVDFRGSEICSYAIAERKGANQLSKELSKVSRSRPELPQVRNPQKCDRNTKNWLAQLEDLPASQGRDPKAIALHLLSDKNFKPFFGKNAGALNPGKVAEISAQLTYGCREFISQIPQFAPVKGMIEAYLTGAFGSAMNLWLDGQASEATNRWMAGLQQAMAQGQAASPDDIAWLRNHLTFVRLPALSSLETLGTALQSYQTQQAKNDHSNEIDKLMQQEPTWTTLLALSRVNPDRNIDPVVRRNMVDAVRAHIAQHWQPAIQNYVAAQQNTLEVARDLFVPMTQQSAIGGMLHYLPAGAVDRINQLFLQRRHELAADFATQESENYANAFTEPQHYVASMKRWQQIERELTQKYQGLLREPPFYPFNAQRKAYYQNLLTNGQAELVAEMAKIDSPTELDAWFNQVFPWDLLDEDARATRSRLRLNRLAEIAPFYGADHADYFDAIFHGDLPRIAQFERNFLQANHSGNLLRGVIAVYLLEYEKRQTRACLQSDALVLDAATSRPATETRDGYGVLINQTMESTSYDRYRVNKEFSGIVAKIDVAALKPGGGSRGFVGGQKEALHNSMRRIMDHYPCDSKQMKTLEKNFIRLYDQQY